MWWRRGSWLSADLNALRYLGVLAAGGGLAWTARTYPARWGVRAILVPATALVAGCFAWAFAKAPPYSTEQVSSPSLVFDYVLYLGCPALGVEFGYAEPPLEFLPDQWHYSQAAAASVYLDLIHIRHRRRATK